MDLSVMFSSARNMLHINTLRFYMCVSVCDGSGKFRGQDYSSDSWPLYLIYFILCVHEKRGHTWGAAAQEDAVGEQQLSGHNQGAASWSGCSQGTAAEVDAIGEQQLKWMHSGSSSRSRHNWNAVRFDHKRLVLTRDANAQGCLC